jgi:hypothetical protein
MTDARDPMAADRAEEAPFESRRRAIPMRRRQNAETPAILPVFTVGSGHSPRKSK